MSFDPLQLLLEMESEMIDNMTDLLARGSIESAEWQAQKLAELGTLREMNIETVEKYLYKIRENLYTSYAEAGKDTVLSAGLPGLSDVLPEGISTTLARVWLIWETQTMNQLKELGSTLIAGAERKYIDIIYKSVAKNLSGALTLRQAIAATSSELLAAGIPALVDKADRTWSLEGYAQMVLRSNERMMLTASQNAAFDEYDVDLVEISSHLGARELCAPYQGKVYSRSGKYGENGKFKPLSSTSIGKVAGLFGINCGHSMYAYNPEVGKTYRPYKKAENDAAYENSQKQRYYERQIRKAKRDLSNAEKFGASPNVIASAKQKVLDAQKDMRQFIDESGRTRRYDREAVYG